MIVCEVASVPDDWKMPLLFTFKRKLNSKNEVRWLQKVRWLSMPRNHRI